MQTGNAPVRRLRVAHVAPFDPGGGNGVSRAVLNWAEVLPQFGIDVEVWDFSSVERSVVEATTELCEVFRLPCYHNRLRGVLSLPRDTKQFLAERAKRVDLLHLHSVFRPENHWAARAGVPFVVSPHNGYHSELLKAHSRWKKLLAGALWERADLNRARRVLVLNERESGDLRAFGLKAPVARVPNILDRSLMAQTTIRRQVGDLWVFIGRLDVEVKGLDALLAGFARFRSCRRRRGARLVIAGTDFRGGMARLQRLAEKLGISRCIDLLGPAFGTAKAELLNRTAVFLHPSRADGLPYAVLEALAYGRPVMLSPSINLAEAVARRHAGWVAQPTPESIAQTFEKMASASPEELEAAGNSAREMIREEFDAEPVARRLAAVYREIVS